MSLITLRTGQYLGLSRILDGHNDFGPEILRGPLAFTAEERCKYALQGLSPVAVTVGTTAKIDRKGKFLPVARRTVNAGGGESIATVSG